jgi:hypothetical protein
MPIELRTFAHTNEIYQYLQKTISEKIQSGDLPLLQNTIRIYTRETITSEYYAMRLVSDGIPSLYVDIKKLNSAWKDYVRESGNITKISSMQSTLILKALLKKKVKLFTQIQSDSSLIKLATEILAHYERTIQFNEDVPKDLKPLFAEFQKYKKNKLTEAEWQRELLTKHFLEPKQIQEMTGGKVYIFGIRSIDQFQKIFLEKLSDSVSVEILLLEPNWEFLHESPNEKEPNLEILAKDHILKLFYDKPIIHTNPKFNSKLYFYSSQEIQREVEFFARHVLGTTVENQGKNFHLTSIKFLIPDDVSYHISVHNTFQKLGIPYSFTNEVHLKKISPYYTAILSFIHLIDSHLEKEKAFALFHNPCFFPRIPREEENGEIYWQRIPFNSLKWAEYAESLRLYGYLDSEHRISQNLDGESDLTWESFWKKATYALLGEWESSQILSEEDKEELEKFIKISSSLFQDLIFLQENDFTPRQFADYFSDLLFVYFDTNPRIMSDDKKQAESIKKNNEYIHSLLEDTLSELRYISENGVIKEDVKFSLKEYLYFLLTKLESPTDSGGSRVLRTGVVVGTLEDTQDISFDSIYILGLNEDRLPKRGIPNEYLLDESNIANLRKNMISTSRENFYQCLSQNAREIHLSYINKDTIKDRPLYPSREYERLLIWCNEIRATKDIDKIISESVSKIPLFSYFEANSQTIQKLVWEKEAIRILEIKQIEKQNSLTNIVPDWEKSNPDEVRKFQSIFGNQFSKLKRYMYLPSEELTLERDPQTHLQIHKFVKFLECARKYFYETMLHLEEETELTKDYLSIDRLEKYQFISQMIEKVLDSEQTISTDELLSQSSNLSTGILQEVEIRKTRKFIEENISNLESLKQLKPKLLSPRFGWKHNSFSAGECLGISSQFRVDFLSLREGKLTIYKKVISKSKLKFKHKLNLLLEYLSIRNSPSIQKELESHFQSSIQSIHAELIHISSDDLKTKHYELKYLEQPENLAFLESKAQEFHNGKTSYFAHPVPENPDSFICDYCGFSKVCPGPKRGFEGGSKMKSELEEMNSYISKLF